MHLKILATCLEGNYCELESIIQIQTAQGTTISVRDSMSEVLFDGLEYNFGENQLQPLRAREVVAGIHTKEYRFNIPKADP